MGRLPGLCLRAAFVAGLFLTAVACRTDGAVQAALHGDLAALQAEIKAAQSSGRFDKGSIEELARAVAGREVRSAKGEPAVERLRSVRACAAPLNIIPKQRATAARISEVHPALCLHPDLERMLDELHLGHEIGDLEQLRRCIAAGDAHVLVARAILQRSHHFEQHGG